MRHFVHLLWRPLEEVIRSEGEKYLNENLLGIRYLLRIVEFPSDLLQLLHNKSLHPMDNRSHVRISAFPSDLLKLQKNKSFHPMDNRSYARISALPSGLV